LHNLTPIKYSKLIISFKSESINFLKNLKIKCQDIHQECFNNTLKVIESIPAISTVLLAATHVTLTQDNQGVNQWYSNSKRIFVDEQGVDWVRRLWGIPPSGPGKFSHNPVIRDHDYQGKLCLAIWEQWELEYLLNHYLTTEKNIWFFGSGFGVRRDPMGWGQLCDLIRHNHIRSMNILTHRHGISVNTELDNTVNVKKCQFIWPDWDQSDWQDIGNDVLIKTTLDWQVPPWE
jgi:hypothetical protein